MQVVVIGPGRAGKHLALCHLQKGDDVLLIGRRRGGWQSWAKKLGISTSLSIRRIPAASKQVFFAVGDSELDSIANEVAKHLPFLAGRIFVHLSGLHNLDCLQSFAERGEMIAAVHPIYSFQQVDSLDKARLGGAAVSVYAPKESHRCALSIVRKWGGSPILLGENHDRRRYHLALTLVSNHLVGLFGRAESILADCLGPESSQVLASLAVQTIVGCSEHGPANALTGPIARGDVSTVKEHYTALSAKEKLELRPLFEALVQFALAGGRINSSNASRLRKVWR